MLATDTQTVFSYARPLTSYIYLYGTSDIQWLVQSITIQLSSQVLHLLPPSSCSLSTPSARSESISFSVQEEFLQDPHQNNHKGD